MEYAWWREVLARSRSINVQQGDGPDAAAEEAEEQHDRSTDGLAIVVALLHEVRGLVRWLLRPETRTARGVVDALVVRLRVHGHGLIGLVAWRVRGARWHRRAVVHAPVGVRELRVRRHRGSRRVRRRSGVTDALCRAIRWNGGERRGGRREFVSGTHGVRRERGDVGFEHTHERDEVREARGRVEYAWDCVECAWNMSSSRKSLLPLPPCVYGT